MRKPVLVLFSLLAASVHAFPLFKLDIFHDDSQTRFPANRIQIRWTVFVKGCSGSMLNPDYLLTANHCSPAVGQTFTSGVCLFFGCQDDLVAERIEEASVRFDYAIVKVRWASDDAPGFQFYPPSIQTEETDLRPGDKLFTVGFPSDKPRGTPWIASGEFKEYRQDHTAYNVGSINGNSGGGVWRESDHMLVTQTNFGPHQIDQPGWNGNDPNNSRAWNGGGRMDRIYKSSALMRQIFPGGKNPYVKP